MQSHIHQGIISKHDLCFKLQNEATEHHEVYLMLQNLVRKSIVNQLGRARHPQI